MIHEFPYTPGAAAGHLRHLLMTWDEIIRRGLDLYVDRNNITYCLGCAGDVAGVDVRVRENFLYYYEHGWADKIGRDLAGWRPGMSANDTWELWLTYNRYKRCFDCSGLICWVCGYEKDHRWSSWSIGAMMPESTPGAGLAGYALWKSGHVALDVAFGFCIEIGEYNHSIEYNKIKNRDFTDSHAIQGVNYAGADAR